MHARREPALERARAPRIYSPASAAVEGDQSNRLGGRGGRGLTPLVRKRLGARRVAMQAVAYSAPVALCVAARRSRGRDVAVCALQMWAYVAAYKLPHDDEAAQARARARRLPDRRRPHRWASASCPRVRLQRALGRLGDDGPRMAGSRPRARVGALDLVHGPARRAHLHPAARTAQRFPRAAVMTYAVFDIGAIFYWVVPTAPPWYAARRGGRGAMQTSGGAAHDGRVRRAVLGRRLGLALQCVWRQSPRRDALSALRHVR